METTGITGIIYSDTGIVWGLGFRGLGIGGLEFRGLGLGE